MYTPKLCSGHYLLFLAELRFPQQQPGVTVFETKSNEQHQNRLQTADRDEQVDNSLSVLSSIAMGGGQ